MRIDDPIAGIGNPAWEDVGGVEPSFPFHEAGTGMEIDPAGWHVDQHPDGSAQVIMHLRQDHHQRSGDVAFQGKHGDMPLSVVVSLRPGETRVRYRMVAENANPTRRPDRMWSDVLFPREPGLEILFPAQFNGDHGFKDANAILTQFPISDSRTNNNISKFALAPHYGFAGGWYPTANANHLRYADPQRFPGMKLYYDEGEPHFFELWGATNQVFEAAEGWVDPWSPLELDQWFAMARGIGRCDFANEFIAFGAEGNSLQLVVHQPGSVTVFERGTNTAIAAAQVMQPGTVRTVTFTSGIRVEIDGVVVADQALIDHPYVPINLDLPPGENTALQTADWNALYTATRELCRRAGGWAGAIDAKAAAAAYEAQNIASKPWEVSLAGVLKTGNAGSMNEAQLISAALASYRLGIFTKVDDFLALLSGTSDSAIQQTMNELVALMAEEDSGRSLDLASLPATHAPWLRALAALRGNDNAAAVAQLNVLIARYPQAIQPRLLRATISNNLSDVLACWRLQPGSPLVLKVLQDMGYSEVSPALTGLSSASPYVGFALQRLSNLSNGVWQHERRLEWSASWLKSGSLPSFPAALQHDHSAAAAQPTAVLAAAPSTDRTAVELTLNGTTHGIPVAEVLFAHDGAFLARDVFPSHHARLDLSTVSPPASLTAELHDVLGRQVTAALGETAPFPRDDSAVTIVNAPITVDVLVNDLDLQNDTISLAASQPSQTDGHATAVQGSAIAVTPAQDFIGQVALPYVVEDNDGSRQGFIQLEVLAENDTPVAEDLVLFTAAGTAVSFAPPYTDRYAPGNYDLVIIENPSHGMVSGTGVARTYTPTPAYEGTDQFLVAISDGDKQSRAVQVTVVVAEPYRAGPDCLVIEAEDFHINTPGTGSFAGQQYALRSSRSGYRQDGYMEVDANPVSNTGISGKPRLDYKVYFPSAGTYGVKVRLFRAW